jgi:hypothetical protein
VVPWGYQLEREHDMTAPRQRRPVEDIPHMQVSEVFTLDVPARPGVAAHRDYLVLTACGREVATTLVTRRDDKVRCVDCKGNL